MILVDTAIWIDHLHRPEQTLQRLLDASVVCMHPLIVGELALGSIRDRSETLALLAGLESMPTATLDEVLFLVDGHKLSGQGLSLVDAHLLASLRLSPADTLWTRDKRLRKAADQMGVSASIEDNRTIAEWLAMEEDDIESEPGRLNFEARAPDLDTEVPEPDQ